MNPVRSAVEAGVFGLLLHLARIVPRPLWIGLGAAVGDLARVADRRHTRIAHENLRLAYGDTLEPDPDLLIGFVSDQLEIGRGGVHPAIGQLFDVVLGTIHPDLDDRPGWRRRRQDLVGPHHLVVLVRQDVAVPHVLTHTVEQMNSQLMEGLIRMVFSFMPG